MDTETKNTVHFKALSKEQCDHWIKILKQQKKGENNNPDSVEEQAESVATIKSLLSHIHHLKQKHGKECEKCLDEVCTLVERYHKERKKNEKKKENPYPQTGIINSYSYFPTEPSPPLPHKDFSTKTYSPEDIAKIVKLQKMWMSRKSKVARMQGVGMTTSHEKQTTHSLSTHFFHVVYQLLNSEASIRERNRNAVFKEIIASERDYHTKLSQLQQV